VDETTPVNKPAALSEADRVALQGKKVFFFDRDGTVSLGAQAIKGAGALITRLRARNIACYVLTNNSSRTPAEHHARMSHLPLSVDEVVVSSNATIAHLKRARITRIHLCATASVSAQFEAAGLKLTEQDPEAAVLTYNNQLHYPDFKRFIECVRAGTPYFASHVDRLYPYEQGYLPDIGWLMDGIKEATGRTPSRCFGKPEFGMVEHLLEQNEASASEAVIVGDRLYTDIALAQGNDLTSVLVLSGEAKRSDLAESAIKPDIVVDSVADLAPLF